MQQRLRRAKSGLPMRRLPHATHTLRCGAPSQTTCGTRSAAGTRRTRTRRRRAACLATLTIRRRAWRAESPRSPHPRGERRQAACVRSIAPREGAWRPTTRAALEPSSGASPPPTDAHTAAQVPLHSAAAVRIQRHRRLQPVLRHATPPGQHVQHARRRGWHHEHRPHAPAVARLHGEMHQVHLLNRWG